MYIHIVLLNKIGVIRIHELSNNKANNSGGKGWKGKLITSDPI